MVVAAAGHEQEAAGHEQEVAGHEQEAAGHEQEVAAAATAEEDESCFVCLEARPDAVRPPSRRSASESPRPPHRHRRRRVAAGRWQVLLECGHGGLCAGCAERLWMLPAAGRTCPLCRNGVTGVVRIVGAAAAAGTDRVRPWPACALVSSLNRLAPC